MILRVISISLLLFITSDHISCQEFDFLHLKDKNRTSIERAGDLFQIAIPIAGLAYTYYSDDVVGRKQFWKSYLSSLSVTYFLKYTIDKKRPNGHCCESFPSGHTASAFSGAMFIQNRYGFKYGIPSIILASYVGYSRVYAKKHYWEDVLFGALISSVSNMIFTNRLDNYNTSIFISPLSNKLSINLSIN